MAAARRKAAALAAAGGGGERRLGSRGRGARTPLRPSPCRPLTARQERRPGNPLASRRTAAAPPRSPSREWCLPACARGSGARRGHLRSWRRRHGGGAGRRDRPRRDVQVHPGAPAAPGRRGAADHRPRHQGGRIPQWVTGRGEGGRAATVSGPPPTTPLPGSVPHVRDVAVGSQAKLRWRAGGKPPASGGWCQRA